MRTLLASPLQQYCLITANYWAFTLTDGALRMLVVLYFYQLGYSPLQIAMLFLFYEFFGVVTNLIGGWLGAHLGLNKIMNCGLLLQVMALSLLLVPDDWLTVAWVMLAQALSGIAKDLNKMSAKSAIKLLVPSAEQGRLYHWVALLTGSKNALKGLGFFLGGLLLALFGFKQAVAAMAFMLFATWIISLLLLEKDLGKSSSKPKFREILSKSRAINILSVARLFLFCSRDVWFVVALPVYLSSEFKWSHPEVGGFLAAWVIGYGLIQSVAPRLTGNATALLSSGKRAFAWAAGLSVIPAAIAVGLSSLLDAEFCVLGGLALFGVVFAINSSLHSFLIVSSASHDGVSLDVGFYYMANALGRLIGTLMSGALYQFAGLTACLWVSTLLILLAALTVLLLPKQTVNISM